MPPQPPNMVIAQLLTSKQQNAVVCSLLKLGYTTLQLPSLGIYTHALEEASCHAVCE